MGLICEKSSQDKDSSMVSITRLSYNTYKNVVFENIRADICYVETDVIVNSANYQLNHNNGLANSIIVKGGQQIQEESNNIMKTHNDGLDVGDVEVTSAGSLLAKHIFHVVCPMWTGGQNNEEEKFKECIRKTLEKANELELKSISIPSLASGVFGFTRVKSAQIIINECIRYAGSVESTTIESIKFINSDNPTARIFAEELRKSLGPSEKTLSKIPVSLNASVNGSFLNQSQTDINKKEVELNKPQQETRKTTSQTENPEAVEAQNKPIEA